MLRTLRLSTHSGALLALLSTIAVRHVAAQGVRGTITADSAVADRAAAPVGRVAAGALLGGAAGLLAGSVTGLYVGGNRCHDPGNPDSCHWLDGLLVGAAVGVTVGTPGGAHLFNRRRGSLAWSLVASAALGVAGAAMFNAADGRPPGGGRNAMLATAVIAVPVLQVVSATIIETRTAKR
jgi:hypothetical protein